MDKQIFLLMLKAFTEEHGEGQRKRIILMLDNAGWYVDEEEVPEGIALDFLPPYSPELQLAARHWVLCDEPLVNRSYDTLHELENDLGARCVELSNKRGVIRTNTMFHW